VVKIPEDAWPAIRARRAKGEIFRSIAKTYKVSAPAVHNYIKRHEAKDTAGKTQNRAVAPERQKVRVTMATLGKPAVAEPAPELPPRPVVQGEITQNDFHDILMMLASCIVTVTEASQGRRNKAVLVAAAGDLLYLAARMKMLAATKS